jgi:hypothetical protein
MGKKRKRGQGQPGVDGTTTAPPPAVTEIVASEAPAAAQPEPTPETSVVQVQASAIAAVTLPEVEPKPETAEVAEIAAVTETAAVAVTDTSTEPSGETSIEELSSDLLSEPPSEVSPSETPPPSEVASASAAPKKKRKKKRVTKRPPARVAATRDALDQKIDRLEAKLEEKKEEAAKAAREGFGKTAEDDTSVPPVDLEVHDEFFAAGEKVPVTRDASGSYAGIDPRHAQKMTAAAHARRAHLSRYVIWAVGAAAGLLVVGLTVSKLRHPVDEPARHEIAHVVAPVETQATATQQAAAAQPPPVQELSDQGNLDDKKADDTKVDDDKKDEVKDEPDKKPDEMPAEKPKNAWQEKQAAKAALERGANGVAIAAGERSVALDPSDGEAWLVLGGAYQAMGNNGQAKRCYNACVSQGKKGPIGDCRDMLTSL